MNMIAKRIATIMLGVALGVALSTLTALPGWAVSAQDASVKVRVGEMAPDFKLISTRDRKISLSDYRGKQMVLVEFYHADFGPT